MNKKVPEITESVEDLKGLLRQAKKKHEIQRLNALYLLKSGVAKNRVEVAASLDVDRTSVGTWLVSAYETGGLEKLLKRGYAPGRVPTLTEAQQNTLRKALEKPEGFQSYVQIQEYIAQTFGVKAKVTEILENYSNAAITKLTQFSYFINAANAV